MKAIFENHALKFHYLMWVLMAVCIVFTGAVNKARKDMVMMQNAQFVMALSLKQIAHIQVSEL